MSRWRNRRWSLLWLLSGGLALAIVLAANHRPMSRPWMVVSSPAGTASCEGEPITDATDQAETPSYESGACTVRFVLRNRGWLPTRVERIALGDSFNMRREILGCAKREAGATTTFTSCEDRIVGFGEGLVIGLQLEPRQCDWSNGGFASADHLQPIVHFGLGPARAHQTLFLDADLRIRMPSIDECRADLPDPALEVWLESYLERVHGRDAAASVTIHHVHARRNPMRLDMKDTPDGNRAAIFSTQFGEAACVGILGFWRTLDVDEAQADEIVLRERAAALTIRCGRPGETPNDAPLVVAARLVSSSSEGEAAPHVLVAGWASPSQQIGASAAPVRAESDDEAPHMAGLRQTESGVFSFSLWGFHESTESIALDLGQDSTMRAAIEPLTLVEHEPSDAR